MTPALAFLAAVIFIGGVVVPVALMIADEARRYPSIYGAGAARRYLEALMREYEMNPVASGVASLPPWAVFPAIGSRNTDEWKADMVERIAAIAPTNVSITEYGTSIRMSPK